MSVCGLLNSIVSIDKSAISIVLASLEIIYLLAFNIFCLCVQHLDYDMFKCVFVFRGS